MTGLLVLALLLCLLKDGGYKATAGDDADYFSYCPLSLTLSGSNPAIPRRYAEQKYHASS